MEPNKIYEEVLCDQTPPPSPAEPQTPTCGYRKCCPTVKIFDDGSVELSDEDPEIGSVGTIKLRPEVAARLATLLADRAKK